MPIYPVFPFGRLPEFCQRLPTIFGAVLTNVDWHNNLIPGVRNFLISGKTCWTINTKRDEIDMSVLAEIQSIGRLLLTLKNMNDTYYINQKKCKRLRDYCLRFEDKISYLKKIQEKSNLNGDSQDILLKTLTLFKADIQKSLIYIEKYGVKNLKNLLKQTVLVGSIENDFKQLNQNLLERATELNLDVSLTTLDLTNTNIQASVDQIIESDRKDFQLKIEALEEYS